MFIRIKSIDQKSIARMLTKADLSNCERSWSVPGYENFVILTEPSHDRRTGLERGAPQARRRQYFVWGRNATVTTRSAVLECVTLPCCGSCFDARTARRTLRAASHADGVTLPLRYRRTPLRLQRTPLRTTPLRLRRYVVVTVARSAEYRRTRT
jgi:hypothetical protein